MNSRSRGSGCKVSTISIDTGKVDMRGSRPFCSQTSSFHQESLRSSDNPSTIPVRRKRPTLKRSDRCDFSRTASTARPVSTARPARLLLLPSCGAGPPSGHPPMSIAVLRSTGALPAQPLIASAVLGELIGENNSELTRWVEIDPALTAAILHAANAPHLRQMRRVSTVRQAMVVLGSSAVEAIAACKTAVLVLGPGDVGCPVGFWSHAIAAAAASAVIAEALGANVDEAFTGGLLHDLGDLILFRSDPEMHGIVAARLATGRRSLVEQEQILFGRSHADVGADQLDRWFFPDRLVRAVRWHHCSPEALTDGLSRAVWAGERLGAVAAGTEEPGPRSPYSVPTAALKAVGLSGESPERILRDIDRRVDRIVKLVGRSA